MKWMLSLLALATVVVAKPSITTQLLPVNPGGIGGLFKGPNSEILIKGPDGSVITAVNQGGEVHTELLADVPIVAAEPSVSPHPTVAVPPLAAVPLVESPASEQSSDVHGSSGRILTKGSKAIIAGPASTTIADGHGVIETSAVSDAETPIGLIHNVAAVTAAPIIQLAAIPVATASIPLDLSGTVGSTVVPISTIQGVSANLPIETVDPQALGVSAPRVVATTTLNTLQASVAVPTLAPQITSTPTASSLFIPAKSGPVINGILPSRIDGKIDLGPPIHLNQLSLDRTLIPSANIIPPEIGRIGILSPSTAAPSLLASPRAAGLATISSIGSVQRSDIDATAAVPVVSTVSPLGVGSEILIRQDARLQNVNLHGPTLETVDPNNPRLQSVNLQDPSLQNVNINDPRLQNVNLQDPSLQNVNLNDPRLQNVILNDPRLQNVNLQNPSLQNVNFNDPRLQNVNLQDPSLQNVNLNNLRLENVILNDPRLQNVNLQNPSLQNVNLQDPRPQNVNLNYPRLQDVNLQDPSPQNVNLNNPRLQNVNLQSPRLQSVNLQDPNSQNVNLNDPRLQNVNLQHTRLQNVNLNDPRLQQSVQIQPAPVQEHAVETIGTGLVLDGRLSLANVQQQDQQLLSAELAKSGINPAEIQLTSVPLSAISRVVVNPVVNSNNGFGDLPRAEAPSSLNRWGREAKKQE